MGRDPMGRGLLTICFLLLSIMISAEEVPGTPGTALDRAESLIADGDLRSAEELLDGAVREYPRDAALVSLLSQVLFDQQKLGGALTATQQALKLKQDEALRQRLDNIEKRLARLTSSQNLAVVSAQKHIDSGDFVTAVALADRAIEKWPGKDIFYQLKGESLYKLNNLEAAEVELRKALQINPLNAVAKDYVEEIRTTTQAQVSTELAEWISIAKDKVGDFVVTFLALFAAFVVNSLIAPVILQYKLSRARRMFEKGDYDDFTDLIEGLLDLENFAPIRTNFQFLLKHKSYEEAKEILNKYVNTLERLPTLLRILERENEKKLETS